ncbi:MAG: hypothetical protein GF368_00765 [Candidatus Aenigmarchaeota archaeon]|nr:hypothetical protein [Candidatus Aenigmarchaeota archaeon]
MSATKGRCPVCGLFMREFKTHYWRDKKLTFPYELYRCPKHGIFVWVDDKHELADFKSINKDAKMSDIKDENVQWFDPEIVSMKCSTCGKEWKQYKEFPSASSSDQAFCPNNHPNTKENAIKNT